MTSGTSQLRLPGLPEAALRAGIPSFIVMDVMRAAAAKEARGERVIHMEVGQPSTAAPRAAREAVKSALDSQTLGYTMALGTDALRAAIAEHYRQIYGVTVPASRIVVTAGSSAAFVLAFMAAFDVGDRVLLPQPGYPCYRHILTALGQTPVMLATGPQTRFMPTAAEIEQQVRTHGARGLLIASPANPTGTVAQPQRLAEIADACARHGLWFICDEIYHGLVYGPPAQTALAVSDDAIIINSFSKYFSMTGWRIGWMIVPERLVRPIERLAQNFYISPPAISQVAALGAFQARDELEANRAVYAANRDLLLNALPGLGFGDIAPADGAFYLYADVSHMTNDSLAFARRMLDETGVAVTPGVDFDENHGASYLRFSYSGSTADITEAVARMKAWSR